MGESSLLSHIRDALVSLRQRPADRFHAVLTGTVTRESRYGKVLFLTIRDATGHMQLKCAADAMSPAQWQTAKRIRQGTRVRADGELGFNPFQQQQIPTLFVDRIEVFNPSPFSNGELAGSEQESLTTQFFSARIRHKATEFFSRAGYEEFEPTYLSSSQVTPALRGLRVLFPGFGAPAFMAPSPGSQLLQMVFAAPTAKVFCFARCFSNEIRDGYTSAESSVLFTCELNAESEKVIEVLVASIKFIFNDITTAPDLAPAQTEWLGVEPWKVLHTQNISSGCDVTTPTVVMCPPPESSKGHVRTTQVVRIAWPPDRIMVEGHFGLVDSTLSVGAFSIHLERMVPILRDVILRRLRRL